MSTNGTTSPAPTLVRDLSGRPVAWLDEGGERLRDDNGSVTADRARLTDEQQAQRLTLSAAALMRGAAAPRELPASERRVLLDLGMPDVVQPATQFETGVPIREYVADDVCPVKMVSRDRGYFYLENVADSVSLVVGGGTGDGEPPELNPGYAKTQFTTTGYAVAAKLSRELLDNADFDIKARTLRLLISSLRLAREVRVAALLTTSTNYATANRVAAAVKWNAGVNPTQAADMFGALSKSYLPADTLVLSENTAQYFYYTPAGSTGLQIRDYVQAGGEMPRVLVARKKYLTGGALQYIWAPANPANVALVRTPQDPVADISTARTFRWTGDKGARDAKEIVDGVMVRFFWDASGGTYWMVAAHNDTDVILSNQVGAVITGATQ